MKLKLFIICMLMACSAAYGDPPGVEYRTGGSQFKKSWDDFYKEAEYEPDIHLPLKRARKEMTLAICEAVKHPDLKYRRYAIEALGKRKDKRAIPTLEVILKDDKEIYYFRGDALEAINDIDKNLGRQYAKAYGNTHKYMQRIADSILKQK